MRDLAVREEGFWWVDDDSEMLVVEFEEGRIWRCGFAGGTTIEVFEEAGGKFICKIDPPEKG